MEQNNMASAFQITGFEAIRQQLAGDNGAGKGTGGRDSTIFIRTGIKKAYEGDDAGEDVVGGARNTSTAADGTSRRIFG